MARLFSMWRIESNLDHAGATYDRRAALYDRLVRSPTYNRVAWNTRPVDYTAFATRAFASGSGPLLEVAAGTAAAPTTPTLRVRAELLADGGLTLWSDFMTDLRVEHLGMPAVPRSGPSVTERLASAYAAAVAAEADQ